MKRFILIFLVFLLFAVPAAAHAENAAQSADAEAAEVTRHFGFSCDGKTADPVPLYDRNVITSYTLAFGESLTAAAKKQITAAHLYIRFDGLPAVLQIAQYDGEDRLLGELTVEADCLAEHIILEPNCRKLVCSPQQDAVTICDMRLYGEGRLPRSVPVWEPSVEKTDFLIITTHPDDEWLFLGAVYPIYGNEQGLTGTYAYITTPSGGRLHEALNGLWSGGVHTYPYFLGFPDLVDTATAEKRQLTFEQTDVALAYVRLFRKIKPLVVVTQDPNRGEYGHWQHIVGAKAAQDAVALAADPTYDPESAEQYGAWQVQKLYQHLYPDNKIVLDALSPLSSCGGETALGVARKAYQHHASQHYLSHSPAVLKGTLHDISAFGLAFSAVGPDQTGTDMFENIDPALLAKALPPPTPEPTAEPTPEPTAESTAAPTVTAVPTATPASPTADPETDAPIGTGTHPWIWGAGAATAAAMVLLLVKRQRKKN